MGLIKKRIERLEEIRVELTKIYMNLDNPNNCAADMILKEDIEKFKKRFESYLKD